MSLWRVNGDETVKLQIALFLLFSTSVRSCPPANIPTFVDTSRTQLEGPVQAIVPSYYFSCYGNVTMWGACIEPGDNREDELYDIYFQVLRAAPQGPEGCYDLVGYNCIERGMGGVDELQRCIVLEDIPPDDQIQVEPGDVVGFRIEHFNNGNASDGGVQLVTDKTDVTVWYLMGADTRTSDSSTCHFLVGQGPELGRLQSSTNQPPVITAQVLIASQLPEYPSMSNPTFLQSSHSEKQSNNAASPSPTNSYASILPPPNPESSSADRPGSFAGLFVGVAGGVALCLGGAAVVVVVGAMVGVRKRKRHTPQCPNVRVDTSYELAGLSLPVMPNPAYGVANNGDGRDQADLDEYEMIDNAQYGVPRRELTCTVTDQQDHVYSYPRVDTRWNPNLD